MLEINKWDVCFQEVPTCMFTHKLFFDTILVCVCLFVFLSWQTGSVAFMLLSMNALGYIELNIAPVNR